LLEIWEKSAFLTILSINFLKSNLMARIILLSTGHPPKDDRIFHKFAKFLANADHEVTIITSTAEIKSFEDGIEFNCFFEPGVNFWQKLRRINYNLPLCNPEMVICSEPFALFSAFVFKLKKNKKLKLLLDVTEWYPENVANKKRGLNKYATYFLLYFLNLLVSNLANGIIIGEELKKKRYDLIAPFRKKEVISYYPPLSLFNVSSVVRSENIFTICFAGLLTSDRGFERVLQVAEKLSLRNPDVKIRLKLIGKFIDKGMEELYRNASKRTGIELVNWVSYEKLPEELAEADICVDLREVNFIYDNSLPIKIFEYLACGKPVVYSRLKSLKNLFSEIDFGYLVNPYEEGETINIIERYINDKELLRFHSQNGRQLAEIKYNWEIEGRRLVLFIEKFFNA